MVGEPTGAGHGQVRDLGPHPAAGQLGQHPRIPLPGDQRFDHVPGRQGGDAGRHRIDLDAGVFEDLGQPLQFPGPGLDGLLAVAGQLPDRGDLLGRDETAAQQPALQQLGQPLTVFHVGLAARDVLHVPGVDQHHLQRVGLAQGMEDRLPVHPGRLHRHMGDALVDQPAHHLPQHLVERAELAGLLTPGFPGSARAPGR